MGHTPSKFDAIGSSFEEVCSHLDKKVRNHYSHGDVCMIRCFYSLGENGEFVEKPLENPMLQATNGVDSVAYTVNVQERIADGNTILHATITM
jgi:hypothetical protein